MMLNVPQAWKVLSSYIYTMVPCFLILKTKYFTNVPFWILLFHWEFLFFHWKLSFVFLRKVKTCRISLVGVCNDFVRVYISRFIWIMFSTVTSMWCKKSNCNRSETVSHLCAQPQEDYPRQWWWARAVCGAAQPQEEAYAWCHSPPAVSLRN